MSNIYNAETSINKRIEVVVANINTTLNSSFCVYFEPDEFLNYPALLVRWIKSGMWDSRAHQFTSVAELNVLVNKDQSKLISRFLDEFMEQFTFDSNNVRQYTKLPMYQYESDPNSTVQIGCVDIYFPPGNSWTRRVSMDKDVRHYQTDLTIKYY